MRALANVVTAVLRWWQRSAACPRARAKTYGVCLSDFLFLPAICDSMSPWTFTGRRGDRNCTDLDNVDERLIRDAA